MGTKENGLNFLRLAEALQAIFDNAFPFESGPWPVVWRSKVEGRGVCWFKVDPGEYLASRKIYWG